MNRKLYFNYFLLFFLIFISNQQYAQISLGGKPKSKILKKEKLPKPPTILMPIVNTAKLLKEDKFNDAFSDFPKRFAYSIPVNLNLQNAGKWTTLQNGDRIWRLTIESVDALSLNFLYERFYLPKGSLLYIYNQDKSHIIGGFSQHNNRSHKKFATGIVNGDKVTLEYFEPSNVKGKGIISIGKVNHAYRDVKHKRRALGDSNACQVDINCSEGSAWQDEKKGVVRTLLNGTSWCSGSLIRVMDNANCSSYVLTANHCLNGLYDAITAPTIANYICYFNYEYDDCNTGSNTPSDETITGATVIANDSSLDFALLELDADPVDSNYDVYLNGWDARDQIPASGGVGIHHPQGDAKKIATHSGVPTTLGNDWAVFFETTTNGHSLMEISSSGSPLFDANSRILGQLNGADIDITCASSGTQLAVYPKLALSWLNGSITDNRRKLQPWLDPNDVTPLFIDGAYPNDISCTSTIVNIQTSDSTSEPEGTDCNNRTISFGVTLTSEPSDDVNISWTFSGTASNPDDYTVVGGTTHTFTSANWNRPKIVTLSIVQDAVKEANENIIVEISSATGGGVIIGSSDQLIFTLTDDDLSPDVTTIFSEDFEGAISWNQATSSGASNVWSLGSEAPLTGLCAYISSGTGYTYDNTTSAARLQSPNISTIGYTALNLTFDYICEGEASGGTFSDFGRLYYSVDGGANWVLFGTNIHGQSTANTYSITLPAATENVTQFRLGFRWDNNSSIQNQPPFAIDNVLLTGTLSSATDIQTVVNTASGYAEHYLGPYHTVHFYDQTTGRIMLSIEELSGFDYGCTRVEVDRAGIDETAWIYGNQVTNKTFKVTPTTNHPTGSYNITLYYENTELPTFILNIQSMVKGAESINNSTNDATNSVAVIYNQTAFGTHHKFTAQFNTGFSGFGLSNAIPGQLPVELSHFKALASTRSIQLDWATTAEVDNKGFELQRSTNPTNGFRNITWVNGAGTTSKKQFYTFNDFDVIEGLHYYYRLKQVDFDGKFEYSNIVSAKIESNTKQIRLVPNPARDIVRLELNETLKEKTIISIYNTQGKRLKDIFYNESLEIDISLLPKGIYFLNIKNSEIDQTKKLIIE